MGTRGLLLLLPQLLSAPAHIVNASITCITCSAYRSDVDPQLGTFADPLTWDECKRILLALLDTAEAKYKLNMSLFRLQRTRWAHAMFVGSCYASVHCWCSCERVQLLRAQVRHGSDALLAQPLR